jgi:uncharacterized protein (TIGR02453 family)
VPFTSAALAFFRQLARHNSREWFEAHRAAYEREVRDPMRDLVEELDVRLAGIAPEFVGDPRRSPLRIYRDVRFSKDKAPYKTFAGCLLYHRGAGRSAAMRDGGGAAGFYFQLEPGGALVAGGLWVPPRPTLSKVRDAIAADVRGFERAVSAPEFVARFGRLYDGADQMLTRLPRGYAPGHPAERWLRYKSFIGERPLADREVVRPDLADVLTADVAALAPLVRWLNHAIGYLPATRR